MCDHPEDIKFMQRQNADKLVAALNILIVFDGGDDSKIVMRQKKNPKGFVDGQSPVRDVFQMSWNVSLFPRNIFELFRNGCIAAFQLKKPCWVFG